MDTLPSPSTDAGSSMAATGGTSKTSAFTAKGSPSEQAPDDDEIREDEAGVPAREDDRQLVDATAAAPRGPAWKTTTGENWPSP
jgi:hypothetical protein